NVGVVVCDGVATLWGPLTTRDEIRRALKTAVGVRGIQSVHSELYVARDARPLPSLFVLPERMTPDRAAQADALALFPSRPATLAALAKTPAKPPAPGMAMLLSPVPFDAAPEQP